MSDFFLNILANVVSAVLISISLSCLIITLYIANNRRKVFRFFGMSKSKSNLTIYISGVPVSKKDLGGLTQGLMQGYSGTLVGKIEYEAALRVAQIFQNKYLILLPRRLFDFIGYQIKNALATVNVQILICPQGKSLENVVHSLTTGNTICIGSNVYNSSTSYYERYENAVLQFREEIDLYTGNIELCVVARQSGAVFAGRSNHRELGVVQRFRDRKFGNTIIICGGTGQSATKGSVEFLVAHWQNLYERYGQDGEFGICLHFEQQDPDDDLVSSGKVLQEISGIIKQEDQFLSPKSVHGQDMLITTALQNMSLPKIESHHRLLKNYVGQVVSEMPDSFNSLKNVNLKFRTEGANTFFNLLYGVRSNSSKSDIEIPFHMFQQLVFIDLGRWRYSEEFATTMCREFKIEDIKEAVHKICSEWFIVYRKASERLFESDNAALSQYFADHIEEWWNHDKISNAASHEEYRRHLEFSVRLDRRSALEIGCGYGRLERLFSNCDSSHHVDISSQMVKACKIRYKGKNASFYVANLNKLELKIKVQCIVVIQVMMHVHEPFSVLKALATLLTSEGEIWVDFTCARNLDVNYYQESFFTRIYSQDYILEQIAKAGFVQRLPSSIVEERPGRWWFLLCLQNKDNI